MPPRRRPPAGAAPSRHGAEGSVYRRIAAWVVRRDGGTCWICGHKGAGVPDHVIPVTERPDLALTAGNMRAAHGYLKGDPVRHGACPQCSDAAGKPVWCNEIRSMGSVERARRIIALRTGLALGNPEGKPRGERDWT